MQVQSYVLKCILLVIALCFFLSLHVGICVGTKYTQADHDSTIHGLTDPYSWKVDDLQVYFRVYAPSMH